MIYMTLILLVILYLFDFIVVFVGRSVGAIPLSGNLPARYVVQMAARLSKGDWLMALA